jgi:hypothetical protein
MKAIARDELFNDDFRSNNAGNIFGIKKRKKITTEFNLCGYIRTNIENFSN